MIIITMITTMITMLIHPVLRVESEPVSVLAARVVSYLAIYTMINTKIMMIMIIMVSMMTMIIMMIMHDELKLKRKELTARREAGRGRGLEVRI